MVDNVSTIEELNYVPEMPEKAKNIVIIGAGGIVSGSHLPAYKLASYPVVGIYDLNEERAKEVAKQFDIPEVASTIPELVEIAKKNDAVFDIAVPASATASILKQLPDGAAVLMQKPMGESIEQAKEILDICHEKNLIAGVNFQLRQAPYIIAARQLIDEGKIGQIVDIDGELLNYIHGIYGISYSAKKEWKSTIIVFIILTVLEALSVTQQVFTAKQCSILR